MSDVQSDNLPASSEPAVNAPPPEGTPADPATIPPPPPVDNDHVAEGAEQFPDGADAAAHPATSALDRMEEIAVHWGGDVMAELRSLVAEVRSLL